MTMYNRYNLIKNKIISKIKNWWAKKVFSHKNIMKTIGDKVKNFFKKTSVSSIQDEMQEFYNIIESDPSSNSEEVLQEGMVEEEYFSDINNWISVTNSTNVHSHSVFVNAKTSLPIRMGIRFQKQKPRGVPNVEADPHPREYWYAIDSWPIYIGLVEAISKGKFVWEHIRSRGNYGSIHSPASAIPFRRIPYRQQSSKQNERR